MPPKKSPPVDADRHPYLHPANRFRHDHRSTGQRLADSVTGVFGSWRFIVVQTVIVIAWIGANIVAVALRWDPYPFILLNLLFSTQPPSAPALGPVPFHPAQPAVLHPGRVRRAADPAQPEPPGRHRPVKAEHDYRVNQ